MEKSQQLIHDLIIRKRVRMERERNTLISKLEAAKTVQEAILVPPTDVPHVKTFYGYEAAEKTGGDWFGNYFHEKENLLFSLIGDVTGHGVSSALLTAAAAGATAVTLERLTSFDAADAGEANLLQKSGANCVNFGPNVINS